MSPRFYLKKLTSNELGYRKGKLSTGQMFYISKQAGCFFPVLDAEKKNDSTHIEVVVEYREHPVMLRYVHHNNKLNRENGTRDEFRIYLNTEIAPDYFFFRPHDIVVFERIDEKRYILTKHREGGMDYEKLNILIRYSRPRGNHALTDKLL